MDKSKQKGERRPYSPLDDDDWSASIRAATAPQKPSPSPAAESQPQNVVSIAGARPVPVTEEAASTPAPPVKVKEEPPSSNAKSTSPRPQTSVSLRRTIKFQVPSEERQNFSTLIMELEEVLGVTLKDANLGRALLGVLLAQRANIIEAAREQGSIGQRPENKDDIGMAKFDAELQAILETGLRRRTLRHRRE